MAPVAGNVQGLTHEKTRTKTKYLGKFWVYLKNKKSARKLTVHVFIYNRQNAQSNGWPLGRANGKNCVYFQQNLLFF